MALAFIARSVGSALIGNLVNTCSSYLKEYPAASGMQDELNRLQYALQQVQAVLTVVEEGAPDMVQNKGLDGWLWQLRDAVENAEDVLDELDYYKLEKRIRDRDDKMKIDSFDNRIFSDGTRKRLRDAVKGLDTVIAGMGPLLQIVTGFYAPSVKRQKLDEVKNPRQTSCLLTESEVLGRDKERDLIVEWLIKPVDSESEGITFNVSAFTIVGMGGLGKTTLAQLINDDERVKQYFDPIIWVCVSKDFDAETISRKMLESKTLEGLGDKSLNALHEYLKQKLTSKRFLLILDDVWDDKNIIEWEKLVAPLKFGQRGSKILLTTRKSSVVDMAARAMQCQRKSLNLNELGENDSILLFNKNAFLGVNPDDYKNLQPIGEKIVKKLGGCPLAIKIMGGLLYSYRDYDSWERFLKEDTMKLQQGKSDIMTVLRLSYDHLPIHLQVCFRYCSIFRQDHIFKRRKLVEMWIGSGLIPQSICERQRSPEDIGKEYFDLLTINSFFTCNSKISKCYVMHDLLHDLAQFVSREECIRIRGDVAGNIIPETVRHLSFENTNFFSIRAISKLKNLRTLIISAAENYEHNADHLLEFNEVIKGFKNLRLLSLSVDCYSYKLPDKLDSLVHLRYLSLSAWVDTNEHFLDFFRSTLCRLYHLEFLEFNIAGKISDIIEFDGLANLVSLRSFVPFNVTKKIPFVGKLTSIRKLEKFFVQEKSGYKISELNDLRELRRLSITRLENATFEEAIEAKLKDKNYLKSLSLQWSKDRSNSAEADEKLLDNLCPNTKLEKLDIKEYQGVKSPCWMTNLSLVNLTSMVLMGCKGWEHLPPLGGLPSLNTVHMMGMHAVKKIGCSFYGCGSGGAFPSLKKLVFNDMPNLEEWIGIDDCGMFPKLHTMKITRCRNLRGLPALPRCLNQLHIYDVGLTALPAINENCRNNNQQKQFSDPETTLIIEDCEKLQYLPTEFFQKFNTIEVLTIRNCPKLEWIGIDDGCMFPKLHTMRLNDCPNLRGIPTLPRSLKHLSIFNVGLRDLHISNVGLTALPAINEDCRNNNQQEQFSALETLTIEQCKKLQYLPTELFHKFNNLKELSIQNCPKWTIRGISNIQQPSILDERTIGSCGDLEVLLLCSANLTSLTISGLHGVKKIDSSFFGSSRGCAFPSLRDLNFRDLPNLEEWIGIDDECMFPKLHTMNITRCPNLSILPTLPCSLRGLHISNVVLTALPVINEDCGNNNQQEQYSALETLIINHCEKLQYLPTEFFQKFNIIKVLQIIDCPKLTTRRISDIQLPSILDERTIGSCGDLEVPLLCSANLTYLGLIRLHAVKKIDSSFFGSSGGCAFPSLKELTFQDLPNLEEWIGIDDCCMFPKLRTMEIINCPNLSGLPTLPCSLRKLFISNVGLTALPAIDENCENNIEQEQFLAPETLTIKNCEKLQYLPTEFFKKFNTIKDLEISNCPKLTTRGISDIQLPSILYELTIGSCGDLEVPLLCSTNLTYLRLSVLHAVKKIDSSFFGSSGGCAFPSLKYLYFDDLPNLEEWIGINDCCMFPKLHTMEIINCPNLSGLPTLPCSLRKLFISNVGLTALPAIDENCENNNQQEHFQGLENLTIKQCDKLEYIPTEFFQKFNTVKFLKIKKCPKLTTLGISDIRPPSILYKLSIRPCGDLEVSFLWSANLTSLPRLELVDCASITSLPPAQVCARWTMLSYLEIKNCKKLSSFGGIQALVSLRELEIRGCDKLIEVALRQPPFPNDVGQKNAADCFLKLGELSIDHHALLLMEPLRSLSSISSLKLDDDSRLTSLPEEWLLQNHSALKRLVIGNACSLQSLPQSMTKLCSLKSLYVGKANLIQSLPDLPTSLRDLCINGCHPELKERCQKNIGLDWPKLPTSLLWLCGFTTNFRGLISLFWTMQEQAGCIDIWSKFGGCSGDKTMLTHRKRKMTTTLQQTSTCNHILQHLTFTLFIVLKTL